MLADRLWRLPGMVASRLFRSLGARLAVQFGMLFTIAMMVVAIAMSALVTVSLSNRAQDELRASGEVFDRLWQQRANELAVAGGLLARDFGFREAVATGDEATMHSALDNVRARARVQTALIVGIDGNIHGLADATLQSDSAALAEALDSGETDGVAYLGGHVRQVVAAPILSPQLAGWLVLASDVDPKRLQALEKLSPVPLKAEVLVRHKGTWRAAGGLGDATGIAEDQVPGRLFEIERADGEALALARRISPIGGDHRALLVLSYPKALAYAQQRWILAALAGLTLLGLGAVLAVTWLASRQITRPLALLDHAAARVAEGEREQLAVEGDDELARLGRTFNRMVGEIEERERRITHLAFNDTLTGLPNRALFHEQIGIALKSCGPDEQVALLCLDLDHFKTVNDTLGHPAGDRLLTEVAARLAMATQGHFLARLSGDEFAVIQRVGHDREAVERLARALLQAVAQPLDLEGSATLPSTSIGIALYPDDGADAAILTRNADLALYRAKDTGRGTYAYFEEALNEQAQHRRQMEADLRAAIAEGQFELWYQPLIDLERGHICSFEALIRWHHPDRGMVSPAEFIPIAEDSGLIQQIGAWVLQTACRTAATWPDHVRVAVNVSSIQFHRGGLADTVMQALARGGLAAERLEIELTESVFLKGDEATLATLHALQALGVRIALDDFGTGYSSLSYLQSFPFDKLKIDQSFIRNLALRPDASAVVRAIIELAEALGMETTAEGVEEQAQLDELRRQGCATVQGYLFSKPVDAGQALALLEAEQAPLRSAGVR